MTGRTRRADLEVARGRLRKTRRKFLSAADTIRSLADELGNTLSALLGMKTRAAYGAEPVNTEMRTRAQRGSEKLVGAAVDRVR